MLGRKPSPMVRETPCDSRTFGVWVKWKRAPPATAAWGQIPAMVRELFRMSAGVGEERDEA